MKYVVTRFEDNDFLFLLKVDSIDFSKDFCVIMHNFQILSFNEGVEHKIKEYKLEEISTNNIPELIYSFICGTSSWQVNKINLQYDSIFDGDDYTEDEIKLLFELGELDEKKGDLVWHILL